MRLKTKLVIAITSLVFLIAGLLSLVYVSHLVDAAIQQSYDSNRMIANQVSSALRDALVTGLKDQVVDPNDTAKLHELVVAAVRDSTALRAVMESANMYSATLLDISVADAQSRIVVSTLPGNDGKPLPQRPNYGELLAADPAAKMREIYGPPKVYDIVVPQDRNGVPFLSVHVGVRNTFLRHVYEPSLKEAFTLMAFAAGTALIAAFLLSNLALRPLEEISMQLDYWNPIPAGAAPEEGEEPKLDTAQRVSTKIEQIGQRMRNVEEVFSALKENLDQILGNLQDGILLFTGDGRAVLVSEAARRFLNKDNENILGLQASEVFDRSTVLGRTLREAFDARVTLVQEEVQTETGHRLQASVDFIYDDRTRTGLGALVTLHDLESVEQIESELELSRRMAAIGRLTAGVGHEVKNPINAIVVHLELLKNKLGTDHVPAARHLEVIDAEIRRLDRVVQTLVDFSRPVELQLHEQDMRTVIGDVLALAREELSTRSVRLESEIPADPMIVNVDADLLKQAAINVIQNGAQAMPNGGTLRVRLAEERKTAVLRIADEGVGIAPEIRDKIFDLYFTTKSGGSGIGLAMTYRILQLHHGSVEVQSKVGRGTEFSLRVPLAATEWGRRHLQPANVEETKGLET
ncbi:MAG TPA: ATP-binding protein [Terracidiphilus sp.]|nr:ATP-binding protein [Terracidiphilus sp.]